MPLLVAGIGPQGGALSVLKGLFGENGRSLLVNSSRGVIFASAADNEKEYRKDVRNAALTLRDQLLVIADLPS